MPRILSFVYLSCSRRPAGENLESYSLEARVLAVGREHVGLVGQQDVHHHELGPGAC